MMSSRQTCTGPPPPASPNWLTASACLVRRRCASRCDRPATRTPGGGRGRRSSSTRARARSGSAPTAAPCSSSEAPPQTVETCHRGSASLVGSICLPALTAASESARRASHDHPFLPRDFGIEHSAVLPPPACELERRRIGPVVRALPRDLENDDGEDEARHTDDGRTGEQPHRARNERNERGDGRGQQ
jgi:hypothetical protein